MQEKWVWQHPKYPHFNYDIEKLTPILLDIKYYQGLLMAFMKL